MNYKIVTFRGYEFQDSRDALQIAKQRLLEIQEQFPNESYLWWTRIEDTGDGIFKLLTSMDPGETHCTQWLK